MNKYSESNAAFILSVCYGFIPDTAIKLIDCAGNPEKRDKIIKSELEVFFNKHFELSMRIFNDRKAGISVSLIAEKYHIADLTVRRYLDSLETHYLEFKGMIETKMITLNAHPKLDEFLRDFGEYYNDKQAEEKESRNRYQTNGGKVFYFLYAGRMDAM